MKKLKYILLVAVIMLCGCNKDNDRDMDDAQVVGEWHLASWTGSPTVQDVYVLFDSFGVFELYQRIDKPAYEYFKGPYKFDGTYLEGNYNDGTTWSNGPYIVSFEDGGNTMKMESVVSPEDVSVYVKETIPDEIVSGGLGLKSVQDDAVSPLRYL